MTMLISHESHVDHNLSSAVLAHILARFADRSGFFIETITLPDEIGPVSLGLYGPTVGDAPVSDAETYGKARGNRTGHSRMIRKPLRTTHTLTVIAGPTDDGACILYTAFGGPLAPKEPWEIRKALFDALTDDGKVDQPKVEKLKVSLAESEAFWSEHALSDE